MKRLTGDFRPGYTLLVHFKSRDLRRLQRQGQFWHIFFVGEGGLHSAIIAQDEIETWTVHLQLPLDADHSNIDSYDAIYQALGGLGQKYKIEVDEILVRSTYRPSIAVASMYRSTKGSVFLAGDAAHQNIPTGGYGMNMGLTDAFDLGWKLASVIHGSGGEGLLNSYEADRRPTALMSIERSGVHMATHMDVGAILKPDARIVDADTDEGRQMRERVHNHYQTHDGENNDLGVEMGYRYKSTICMDDEDTSAKEPEWLPSRYIPTTWPGSRAPHIFLNDGSAIFDHYGKGYTLIEFVEADQDRSADFLVAAAKSKSVELDHVRLFGEEYARQAWERRLVIVRPDGHVSWRSNAVASPTAAMHIIEVIAGLGEPKKQPRLADVQEPVGKDAATFKMVIHEKQDSEYKLEKMGAFQQ
jgi:FAD-dependent monooxygenase